MDADLTAVKAVLADLSDPDLRGLIDATCKAPQTAPALLAWLEAACDWELNRRAGLDYALQPPDVAIPPEEDAVSIDAATAMRSTFAEESRRMHAVFDALVGPDGTKETTKLRFHTA